MKLPANTAAKILKSTTEAIVVVDAAGKILFANKQAEKLFGYTIKEMVGEYIELLMPEGVRHAHADHRKTYKGTPHVRPLISGLSLQGLRKDGVAFDAAGRLYVAGFDASRVEIFSPEGELVKRVGIPERQVRNLVVDEERGALWISAGRSIYLYELED